MNDDYMEGIMAIIEEIYVPWILGANQASEDIKNEILSTKGEE